MTRVRIPLVTLKTHQGFAHFFWWSQQGSPLASEGKGGRWRDELWKNEHASIAFGTYIPARETSRCTQSFEECQKFGHLKETI